VGCLRTFPTSLEVFVNLVAGENPFSFSRWNDGQWRMVLGVTKGQTGDGHKYAKEIGDDLVDVLLGRPEYMLGIQGLSLRGSLGEKVRPWIEDAGIEDLRWFDADVFHHACRDNKLAPMIRLLLERKVIVVGPPRMESLPFASKFVSIPKTDTYYEKQRIINQVAAMLQGSEPAVVSISAGWTANLLISELYPRFGDRHTFIDFGSVWDPYVGVYSRGYMKKGNFKLASLSTRQMQSNFTSPSSESVINPGDI